MWGWVATWPWWACLAVYLAVGVMLAFLVDGFVKNVGGDENTRSFVKYSLCVGWVVVLIVSVIVFLYWFLMDGWLWGYRHVVKHRRERGNISC